MTVQVNNTGSVPVTIENIDMTTSDAFRVDSITTAAYFSTRRRGFYQCYL